MVSISSKSTYLTAFSNTLVERGVDRIIVMVSRFGLPNSARSEVLFQDKTGTSLDRAFLEEPVEKESQLKNKDIMEMFIGSHCKMTNSEIGAASFTINPQTWNVVRTQAKLRSPVPPSRLSKPVGA